MTKASLPLTMKPIPRNLEPKVFISGFVGIAESWDFMVLGQKFLLPHDVKISTCEDSSFQGMAIMSDIEQVFQLEFGSHKGYSLSQVILCRGENQIPLTAIENEFVAAIDYALEQARNQEGGPVYAVESCRKYSQVLSSCPCCNPRFFDSDEESVSAEEYPEDKKLMQERDRLVHGTYVKAFGAAFNANFRQRIQEIQDDCQTFTVLKRLEQTCELFEEMFPSINVCKFREISITFVKEYSSRDCSIFWNRELVVAHMEGQVPSQEFYPGLLNRLGNFTYKLKPIEGDSFQITRMEFSSRLFHQLRNGNKMIQFHKPLLTDYLAGCGEERLSGKSVNCLWLVLSEDQDKWNPAAQFRVVFTSEEPSPERLLKMRRFFKDSNRMNTNRLFTAYTVHDIKRYIDATMLPPLRTLHTLYQEGLAAETDYVPKIESLKLCSLCEAIVCFGINGTARDREGNSITHPEQLICDFGLIQSTFRNGELFKGLGNLQNIGVVDENLVILDYSKVELHANIFYSVDEKGLLLLDKSLIDIKNGHLESKPFKVIAKLFWLAIEKFVLDTYLSENRKVVDLWDVAALAKDKKMYVKLMSCRELLEFLNSSSCPDLPICTGFLKIIKYNLTSGQFADFLKECTEFLENRLYYPSTALLFPVRARYFDIVILPCRVTHQHDFEFMDEVGWQLMYNYYEMIYEKFFYKTIPKIQELLFKVQKNSEIENMQLLQLFIELNHLNVDGVLINGGVIMSTDDESDHSNAQNNDNDNDVDMGE